MPNRISRPARPRAHAARRRAGIAGVAAITAGGAVIATAPAAAAPAGATGHPSVRTHPAPAEPATLLEMGSAGRAVSEVQHALKVRANGHFDRATKRAVISFQRRHRLLVDGVVGPQTWDTLFHIKPRPVSIAASGANTTSGGAPASYSGGGYAIPASIVQCESGGNYSAVNPSSGAGGAYQILPSTWRAYGGQGLPQNASPAEQGRIAAAIYARQGRSAWSC